MFRCAITGLWRTAGLVYVLMSLAAMPVTAQARCGIGIDGAEAAHLADKIWANESGRDPEKILWWNRGENFASLGIGHFIWYPAGVEGPFLESFPPLLGYLAGAGVPMPAWLAEDPNPDCPWSTREQFMAEREGAEARQLRRLLLDSAALQAQFMLARLSLALDTILASAPVSSAEVIEARFCALASSPAGRYALVDYVNFKGEGTKAEERYAGQGWGLAQALLGMRGTAPANVDFAESAARVLRRRVDNAPSERGEQRWLAGWLRRVESYR